MLFGGVGKVVIIGGGELDVVGEAQGWMTKDVNPASPKSSSTSRFTSVPADHTGVHVNDVCRVNSWSSSRRVSKKSWKGPLPASSSQKNSASSHAVTSSGPVTVKRADISTETNARRKARGSVESGLC